MKLKCVNDQETVKEKTGLFSSKEVEQKVEGITVGKTYQAFAGPICENYSAAHYTEIYGDDYCFLIFNDDREWIFYDTYHFEPVEER